MDHNWFSCRKRRHKFLHKKKYPAAACSLPRSAFLLFVLLIMVWILVSFAPTLLFMATAPVAVISARTSSLGNNNIRDENNDSPRRIGIVEPTPPTSTITISAKVSSVDQNRIDHHNRDRYRYHPPMPRRTTEAMAPAKECGSHPNFDRFFLQGDTVRSSRNEDKSIYQRFFQHYNDYNSGGNSNSNPPHVHTYVEIGAFNGMRESNSRFFDVCLGWDGLLIEANPLKYPKLIRSRPHAHRMNFAASCDNGKEEAAGDGGSGKNNNRTVDFYSVSFTNAAQANVPNAAMYNEDGERQVVPVPCGSMTPVLLDVFKSTNGHVSFFSLDVEGAEAMVLENIDFAKVFVEIIIMENTNLFCRKDCPSRDRARAILKNAGYIGFTNVILGSDLFVHPKSRRHLEATRDIPARSRLF
jgi:hypothetical protein